MEAPPPPGSDDQSPPQPYWIIRSGSADEPGLGDVGEHRVGRTGRVVGRDPLIDPAMASVRRDAERTFGLAHIPGGIKDLALHGAHDGSGNAVTRRLHD